MKLSKLASMASLVVLTAAVQAQPITIVLPDDAETETVEPGRTRAEVLADLHLWRLSGLESLSRGEAGPQVFSEPYRKAQARYAWLRASPQYAALVEELQRRPGASVIARQAAPERQAADVR